MKVLDRLSALGREVPPATEGFKFVYLWGWPLRAMHWAAALSILGYEHALHEPTVRLWNDDRHVV